MPSMAAKIEMPASSCSVVTAASAAAVTTHAEPGNREKGDGEGGGGGRGVLVNMANVIEPTSWLGSCFPRTILFIP